MYYNLPIIKYDATIWCVCFVFIASAVPKYSICFTCCMLKHIYFQPVSEVVTKVTADMEQHYYSFGALNPIDKDKYLVLFAAQCFPVLTI